MTSYRTILVLEDMPERVVWLMTAVEGLSLEVEWCQTVTGFRAVWDDGDYDIALIILDHDLGRTETSDEVVADAYGETGLHAAEHLPAGTAVPVLVWSLNGPAAEKMVHTLHDKNIDVAQIPFLRDNHWKIRKTLADVASLPD